MFDTMLDAFGGFTADDGTVDTRFGASKTGLAFQKRLVQYAGAPCFSFAISSWPSHDRSADRSMFCQIECTELVMICCWCRGTGMFCCLNNQHPGHIFYDFFFDVRHLLAWAWFLSDAGNVAPGIAA